MVGRVWSIVMAQAIDEPTRRDRDGRGIARGAVLLALALAAACAGPSVPPEVMGDRCQLKKCVCLGAGSGLFNRSKSVVPPQWALDGTPFCDAGYSLVLEDDSKGYLGKGIKTYDD